MKNTSRHILTAIALAIGLCCTSATKAQTTVTSGGGGNGTLTPTTVVIPAASFNGADLSMLTNHAALVKYCFKQVKGIQVNVTSQVQADDNSNLRSYVYTNNIKSLDDIMSSLLTNEVWYLHVTSTTDYFNLSISMFDTVDCSDQSLFTGGSGGQAQQNQYGQWVLPPWSEDVGVSLNYQTRITLTNTYIVGAKVIARDQYGNPYPITLPTYGLGGFDFRNTLAGNGVLVLSGYSIDSNGNWQSIQSAISLKDGSPVALKWVEAQVILQSSSDIATFKNTSDLSTYIWSWYGVGVIPMGQPVFTHATTNVLLYTYTSDGQYASSYDVEDQATGKVKTYVVPAGASSVSTGTNVMMGTYDIVPQGISLTPPDFGYYYGGQKGG